MEPHRQFTLLPFFLGCATRLFCLLAALFIFGGRPTAALGERRLDGWICTAGAAAGAAYTLDRATFRRLHALEHGPDTGHFLRDDVPALKVWGPPEATEGTCVHTGPA